ncbi:hypothetical protein [Legionella tunisiensis]|uniref:hypothetical protein n=1 Tax=Legionella tunisiensis TaxID=1034944 RepID=UPI0002D8AA22|nr:hypothetical protein [Legionella tunisiensis]
MLINSLVNGVNQALGQEERQESQKESTSKNTQERDAFSELTDIFRGITLGIMDSRTTDEQTKLAILTKLVETIASKHIPQVQLSLNKPRQSCEAAPTIEPGKIMRTF